MRSETKDPVDDPGEYCHPCSAFGKRIQIGGTERPNI